MCVYIIKRGNKLGQQWQKTLCDNNENKCWHHSTIGNSRRRELAKRWCQTHPEYYQSEGYKAHTTAYHKQWYQQNKERLSEHQRNRRKDNPQKIREIER